MRAWVLTEQYGAPANYTRGVLHLKSIPIPTPEGGDIVVRVHAIGLNPVDYMLGAFDVPRILGCDGAGTVHAIGSAVTDFKIGDRVYLLNNIKRSTGTFAEYTPINAKTVTKLPDDVSFEEAAALPCASWTAYKALYDKVALRPDQTILVTAAAGGVGGFAVQLAKLRGCSVIIGTCSEKNSNKVRSLGATHVIDYSKEDVVAKVKEITGGRGVDVWMDNVSSESCTQGVEAVAHGGHVVVVSGAPAVQFSEIMPRQLSLHSVYVGAAHTADEKAQRQYVVMGKDIIQLVQAKKLDPLISQVIPFEGIPEALEKLKARHVVGKIVAKLD